MEITIAEHHLNLKMKHIKNKEHRRIVKFTIKCYSSMVKLHGDSMGFDKYFS